MNECPQHVYGGNCSNTHPFECAFATRRNNSVWPVLHACHAPNTALAHYILNAFSLHSNYVKNYIPQLIIEETEARRSEITG